ncbi:MAG: PBP1A family penicillin-binding protein [Acidobacteriota bacterium]|nr:PBP1A family penicillin-binding protein [Acidobacteriota bacterium]
MRLRFLQSLSVPTRLLLGAIAGIVLVFAWIFVDLVASMPGRDELRAFSEMARASVLFDKDDHAVFTIAKEHRIEVPLSELSPRLVQAVIAIEDRRFFEHDGFDPIRIAGSALAVLRAGSAVQGGSTITQQLARQSVGREKTLRRKVKEMLFAMQLERHFTKEEILELYLNKVYFGDGLYGAEAASRGFFDNSASNLSLGEAALLAGLLKAPSAYAPTVSAEKAEARQAVVLRAMLDNKAITEAEYRDAIKAPVYIRDGLRAGEPHGRYFKDEVKQQLVQQFGSERVSEGGLQVYTTIDLPMQQAAEAAVQKSLAEIDRTLTVKAPPSRGALPPSRDALRGTSRGASVSSDPLQAALIAIDPASGAVRALVGGRDFDRSSYDRATQARRQPGSAFKPFVYAAAIEAGYSPDDTLDNLDEPFEVANTSWTPDDEHSFEAELTLREGLRVSSNRAAVKLLGEVGLRKTMQVAKSFGFDGLPSVPSIALGSGEVTLAAITSAYGAFANGGLVSRPWLIRRVVDRDGTVLFENGEKPRRAIKPVTAYLMADMLKGVVDAGTGSAVRRYGFTRPAGGKTGTTNDYYDAWFVGFTPRLVTGVWVGFDHPRSIRRAGYASELAVPMWARFMTSATKGDAVRWVARPRGIDDDRLAMVAEAGGEKKRGFWGRIFSLGR